jgi:folylpolyglutamate synthase
MADLDGLRVIHVTGTKGKGSTCAFVEAALRRCGLRTGLYTSPHLVEVRERIRINGAPLDRDAFARYFEETHARLIANQVRPRRPTRLDTQKDRERERQTDTCACVRVHRHRSVRVVCLGSPSWKRGRAQTMPSEEGPPAAVLPTYFRFLMLMAVHAFVCERTDVVILEVGIGGRYDATNVVARPVVCGITSIGLDHQAVLGATHAAIAHHKGGILKARAHGAQCDAPRHSTHTHARRYTQPGVPAYTVPQVPSAAAVLDECARENQVRTPACVCCRRVAHACPSCVRLADRHPARSARPRHVSPHSPRSAPFIVSVCMRRLHAEWRPW